MPNYINPETRGPGLIITNVILLALMTLVMSLRFYTRLRITKSFGADDILIGFALIPTLGLTITVLLADTKYGWDRHVCDSEPKNFVPGLKLVFIASTLFALSSWLTKLSLLVFYLRLLTSSSWRYFSWFITFMMLIATALCWAYMCQLIFLCSPTKAQWEFVPPLFKPNYPFKCNKSGYTIFSSSIVNTSMDFAVMATPIPMIWDLQLPVRQRIAVISLFSLGTIVCLAGVVKSTYVDKALMHSYDETWPCASIPALRPFMVRYITRLLSTTRLSSSRQTHPRRKTFIHEYAMAPSSNKPDVWTTTLEPLPPVFLRDTGAPQDDVGERTPMTKTAICNKQLTSVVKTRSIELSERGKSLRDVDDDVERLSAERVLSLSLPYQGARRQYATG